MYKVCKTAASSERQKEFEQTLFRMMQAQSFKDITVTALCKEMNAPRKAFYRYFDTMEDVLDAFLYEILMGAYIHLDVYPELDKFFQYWKEQKHVLDILEKNGLSQRLIDHSLSLVLTDDGIENLSNRKMKHVGQISAILTIMILWHHSGMKQSTAEMKALVLDMLGLSLK